MDTGERQHTNGPHRTARAARTRLQQWLDANGFTAADLEKAAEMGRESVARLRRGKGVRLTTMVRILAGARKLAGRTVAMEELFPLEPQDGQAEPEVDREL